MVIILVFKFGIVFKVAPIIAEFVKIAEIVKYLISPAKDKVSKKFGKATEMTSSEMTGKNQLRAEI